MDLDTDNDGYSDYIEGHDTNLDAIVEAEIKPSYWNDIKDHDNDLEFIKGIWSTLSWDGFDSDNDGLDNAYDNINGWSDYYNPTGSNAPLQDRDNDGIRDWRDPLDGDPNPECDLFIPNGFSPNDDEINDYFVIELCDLFSLKIEIYNRWGNLVYEKENYGSVEHWGSINAWWDGRSSHGWTVGKDKLPPGTYFYILYLDDGKEPRAGSIFLNR